MSIPLGPDGPLRNTGRDYLLPDRDVVYERTPPRPEPVAPADLVAQAREQVAHYRGTPLEDQTSDALLTALAAALEDTAAERDRAHATLREIAPVLDAAADQAASLNEAGMSADLDAAYRLARERLENP